MRHLLTITVVAMLAAMVSCIGGDKYVVENDQVVFTYWTFSFGRINDTLQGADAATFKAVNNWLGRDAKHVFYQSKLVPGADPATLQVIKRPLFRDSRDYYYESTPMRVADVSSFEVLKWTGEDFWAQDSRCVYFDTVCIDYVDKATFELLNVFFARDKNHVYYFGDTLPQADPATFEVIGHSIYMRDKSHVWCGDEILEDADLATFVVDDMDRAHDKFGRYVRNERDTTTVEE